MGALPTPLSPVIHTSFYLVACLRKSPTLLIKRVTQTTHFCHIGDNLFLQGTLSFLTAFTTGQQALGVGFPQPISTGWSHPGCSGVCPHQSCTDLSLGRSVLTVTCSGGRLQWRLEVPLCGCQLQHLAGFCSRTSIGFYSRVNALS